MCEPDATRTVTITNSEGLHARAASLVADLVRQYGSKVRLVKNQERVEGTEVLQILSLGVAQGEELLIEAIGHDAEAVLDALEQLFTGNFAEGNQEKTEQDDSGQNGD